MLSRMCVCVCVCVRVCVRACVIIRLLLLGKIASFYFSLLSCCHVVDFAQAFHPLKLASNVSLSPIRGFTEFTKVISSNN